MELQQLKLMLTVSQGLLKAQKKQKIYTSKLEPLHRICIRWAIQKSSKFFFFFFTFFPKFVEVETPNKADVLTFKKYVTAQANFFQMH